MRWSISTKIFLFFAVVIFAFGGASAYTVVRMTALRASFTILWEEAIPVSNKLKSLGRRLETPEEFLAMKRPGDAQWVTRILPRLEPFKVLRQVEGDLEQLTKRESLEPADRDSFAQVLSTLRKFRTSRALLTAVAKGQRLSKELAGERDSEAIFEELVGRTVALASSGDLSLAREESYVMIRALRQTNRLVMEAARSLSDPIQSIQGRAAADEEAARLAVLIIAAAALGLSLLMLVMVQLTVRPLRLVREAATRIAAGNYDERVKVASRDEIGQLAEEFNTMGEALQERDAALARQRDELIRADRLATIGKMAAQVTHEVRNPLSSIGLNAELLEEELERLNASEAGALLKEIQGEVQRLESITEEYLRYARMPTPDRERFDLISSVQSFQTFIQREMDDAGVLLDLALPDGSAPIHVLGDRDQIRQALLNLARNAREALREEPEPRRLRLQLRETAQGSIEIIFEDNGPGMDLSLVDQIFEPFVTTKEGGTGLGLVLTRQIAQAHGGSVHVEQRPDGQSGARFILALPRVV